MANTVIYKEDWKTALQDKLNEEKYFEKIAKVEYTDRKVLNNPYSSDPATAAYTRGAQYTFADFTLTNETVDINDSEIIAEFIDRADLAQSGYDLQMDRAERQGEVIKDTLEADVLATFAQFGNTVDDSDLSTASNGGAANSPIVASTSNIKEVIALTRKKIVENKGLAMLNRFGGFIVWDPANYQTLVETAQVNGFRTADEALTKGALGFEYGGFMHYESNLLDNTTDAGTVHCIGGVNGVIHLGVLNTTYGDIMVDENDPDNRSGISVVSRVDRKAKVWNNTQNLLVDIHMTG